MSAASHDEIVGMLGDIDELIVERLVETGASLDEIAEAWGDLADERRADEPSSLALSPKVTAVRSILEQVRDDIDDDGADDNRLIIVSEG